MNGLKEIMRPKGFTLIEMMAALLIASVMLAAMYQNFIVTHRTYQLLEGFSLLQENARFSSDLLARTIRMTGFRNDPGVNMDSVFPANNNAALVHGFAAGQLVAGENNNAAADTILDGSDSISIRYQSDALGSNCVGTPVAAGNVSVNIFYVDTTHTLQCKPIELDAAGAAVGGTASKPLIEGVEDMQILYGVDNNSSKTADTYLNAAEMAAGDWPNVVSVRISVLYTTVNRVNQNLSQSFTMLDNGVSNFNDGLRRQLFTATVNLRNESQ